MTATAEPLAIPAPVRDGLRYGCSWHGRLLSDHCCECGMLKFWRDEIDAGRAVERKVSNA